jgi:hypothetical protein
MKQQRPDRLEEAIRPCLPAGRQARPAATPSLSRPGNLLMNKTTCVKSLLLVLPETAQQRGIPAEGPVFISPNIDRPRQCGHCPATYTPLVSSFLMPVCDADDPDADCAPFTFQIQAGTVYFSRRS